MAVPSNKTDSLFRVPAPTLPRTKHDLDVHSHTTSARHGQIIPFYCDLVYPSQSKMLKAGWLCKADISSRVPLDDIVFDIYYFSVPLRLIDPNFAKALGDKSPLDTNSYEFAKTYITFNNIGDTEVVERPDSLLSYLGWNHANIAAGSLCTLNAWKLGAYWQIINDYFRDEYLDPIFDYQTLLYGKNYVYNQIMGLTPSTTTDPTDGKALYFPFTANKLTDPFTRALTSPTFGDPIKIPMATWAPLDTNSDLTPFSDYAMLFGDDDKIVFKGKQIGLDVGEGSLSVDDSDDWAGEEEILSSNLGVDVSKAAGTIQELQLAMNIAGLRYRQQKYGHRYIEQIHGLWGYDVPDVLVGRAEYLGGTQTTLQNIPVLNTSNVGLGTAAGNGSTLFTDDGIGIKTFMEWSILMGVCVARVHHRYAQAKDYIWDIFEDLDLYNPAFANLAMQPLTTDWIYNNNFGKTFGYIESNIWLKCSLDRMSGIFNPNTSTKWDEFRTLWSYADYYSSRPTLSASWLKEDASNVARTLSGNLIPYAGVDSLNTGTVEYTYSPQYLFSIYFYESNILALPAHPHPDYLEGRL